jgi:hypothetical protein
MVSTLPIHHQPIYSSRAFYARRDSTNCYAQNIAYEIDFATLEVAKVRSTRSDKRDRLPNRFTSGKHKLNVAVGFSD